MKTSLAIFMVLAFTAIIIVALVFNLGGDTMNGEANKYQKHIEDNMDTVIQSEMTSTP